MDSTGASSFRNQTSETGTAGATTTTSASASASASGPPYTVASDEGVAVLNRKEEAKEEEEAIETAL